VYDSTQHNARRLMARNGRNGSEESPFYKLSSPADTTLIFDSLFESGNLYQVRIEMEPYNSLEREAKTESRRQEYGNEVRCWMVDRGWRQSAFLPCKEGWSQREMTNVAYTEIARVGDLHPKP
jgi:hypothetical protein